MGAPHFPRGNAWVLWDTHSRLLPLAPLLEAPWREELLGSHGSFFPEAHPDLGALCQLRCFRWPRCPSASALLPLHLLALPKGLHPLRSAPVTLQAALLQPRG